MIRICICGHRNHRSGVGRDIPAGCHEPTCRCTAASSLPCPLLGRWTERWECDGCGARLATMQSTRGPRRRRWCSETCELAWQVQHVWSFARPAALERDHRACVVCGASAASSGRALEVNHIEPRRGAGYRAGCHHHQALLETLCHAHHVEVTAAQRAGWVGSARELLALASPLPTTPADAALQVVP